MAISRSVMIVARRINPIFFKIVNQDFVPP